MQFLLCSYACNYMPKICTHIFNYVAVRLKSIMLQNLPIILSGTSFFLTYYSQNYAHNFYDSCSQFTHYV